VPLLVGTTDDDGNPYTVVGDKPTARCPECDAKLPAENAASCNRCGWDRAAGKRLPKTFAPIDRTWESGWSLRARMTAFVVCQALNVVTAALIWSVEGRAVTTIGGFVVMVLTQAFLLGTFDRLTLTRSTRGKVTLKQQWRIAFWPLQLRTLRWREHEEIRILHAEADLLEWLIFFVLLSTLIGAILWYWFMIRPGHVKTALCQTLGDPVAPLYIGTSIERAEEIAREVSAATGIIWRPHGG
jgi:hypothetical protein